MLCVAVALFHSTWQDVCQLCLVIYDKMENRRRHIAVWVYVDRVMSEIL